jgi:hypothetical protein
MNREHETRTHSDEPHSLLPYFSPSLFSLLDAGQCPLERQLVQTVDGLESKIPSCISYKVSSVALHVSYLPILFTDSILEPISEVAEPWVLGRLHTLQPFDPLDQW